MKSSQFTRKTLRQTLRSKFALLPAAGAALLLGSASPVLADHQHSRYVGEHKHQPAAKVRQLERKVNRTVRRLTGQLDSLQPVSHRSHRQARHRGADRFGHRYFRHDARYQPMNFRQWKRYQWRMTHDNRYVTERGYMRYLKKYRKHYTHGHKAHRYARVDSRANRGRGHNRRAW